MQTIYPKPFSKTCRLLPSDFQCSQKNQQPQQIKHSKGSNKQKHIFIGIVHNHLVSYCPTEVFFLCLLCHLIYIFKKRLRLFLFFFLGLFHETINITFQNHPPQATKDELSAAGCGCGLLQPASQCQCCHLLCEGRQPLQQLLPRAARATRSAGPSWSTRSQGAGWVGRTQRRERRDRPCGTAG